MKRSEMKLKIMIALHDELNNYIPGFHWLYGDPFDGVDEKILTILEEAGMSPPPKPIDFTYVDKNIPGVIDYTSVWEKEDSKDIPKT